MRDIYSYKISLLLFYVQFYLVIGFSVTKKDLDRPGRIVGGQPVNRGDIPWQVSLQTVSSDGDKAHFCGGALIKNSWVITAAHCTRNFNREKTIAVLGAWDLNENNSEYRIVNVFRDGFDAKTMQNDIALLQLDMNTPLKVSARSQSTDVLLERDLDIKEKECLISGWGRLSYEGDLPHVLHAAKVSLRGDEECISIMKKSSSKDVHKSNVCAGGGDIDACQGDSGGPLVCCDDSASKNCRLTGVTSWGVGCATPGVPGVYTEIAYYTKWINKITGNEEVKVKIF